MTWYHFRCMIFTFYCLKKKTDKWQDCRGTLSMKCLISNINFARLESMNTGYVVYNCLLEVNRLIAARVWGAHCAETQTSPSYFPVFRWVL